MSEDSDARAFEDFATAQRKEIVELRARIAQLQQSNATLTEANAEYAKRHLGQLERIAQLEAEKQKIICDSFTALREKTVENQRLRADAERLDWLSAHSGEVYKTSIGWCAGGDVAFTVHAHLRSAIDAARGK